MPLSNEYGVTHELANSVGQRSMALVQHGSRTDFPNSRGDAPRVPAVAIRSMDRRVDARRASIESPPIAPQENGFVRNSEVGAPSDYSTFASIESHEMKTAGCCLKGERARGPGFSSSGGRAAR